MQKSRYYYCVQWVSIFRFERNKLITCLQSKKSHFRSRYQSTTNERKIEFWQSEKVNQLVNFRLTSISVSSFFKDKFTQFVNPEKVFLRFKSKIISVKMCYVSICIFQTIFFFAEKVVIKANVGANIPKQWMKKLCLNIKKKWLF
jgi:hypothetical protein